MKPLLIALLLAVSALLSSHAPARADSCYGTICYHTEYVCDPEFHCWLVQWSYYRGKWIDWRSEGAPHGAPLHKSMIARATA